jgi:hypothetical protein
MKIKWHEVTWYSKAIALAVFILISLGGFCLGLEAGYLGGYADGVSRNLTKTAPISSAGSMTNSYYQNVADWQMSEVGIGGFSISYPIDFPSDGESAIQTTDWRVNAPRATPGTVFFSLVIPKAFEPQTNFDDAKLTVGRSQDAAAVKDCLLPDQTGGPLEPTSTVMLNGIPFATSESFGAGAGNLYDTTSYRALHAGECYAIEYTIHASQIANFPPEYHLRPFDAVKLNDVLHRIAGTFRFL